MSTKYFFIAAATFAVAACTHADAADDSASGGAAGTLPADRQEAPKTPLAPRRTEAEWLRRAPVESRLTVPEGMVATVYATVPGARALLVAEDGSVYVSQPVSNQITRLYDRDHRGVAEANVVITGLKQPHGMAFHNGYFYIANTDGVVRAQLDVNGKPLRKVTQVNHYSGGGGHWTRSIIFGSDNKMYVSIGSTCNVCEEKTEDRAAVMQYDENGKNGRVFSRGLRNAVGMAENPATKQIWVTQNERDNLEPDHENLPPEEINILRDGGDYGWPYCYGNKLPSPEYHDADRCSRTIAPALEMQAHSAPLGMTFLRKATQLPANERGDLLVAFHGSWNRKVPTGAKVVRIVVQNNKPVRAEDFVTGWQRADGSRWGRPVDVAVMKDGSILISDDGTGEIVRVAKK